MDGSGTAFLRDTPGLSGMADGLKGGILYFEDFDHEPQPDLPDEQDDAVTPQTSLATMEDLERARQDGRQEGMRLALADAQLVQLQLETAALQTLADTINATRNSLDHLARQSAADGMRAVLAILRAAVPATMARHAACELDAVVDALMPGLACMPELRVRTHPDLADHVRDNLMAHLEGGDVVLSVAADPKLQPGDLQVAWQDGGARRDCASIYNDIKAALNPLGLPDLEEICCGSGR